MYNSFSTHDTYPSLIILTVQSCAEGVNFSACHPGIHQITNQHSRTRKAPKTSTARILQKTPEHRPGEAHGDRHPNPRHKYKARPFTHGNDAQETIKSDRAIIGIAEILIRWFPIRSRKVGMIQRME